MVNSMTGFASSAGAAGNLKWTWDLRSVNAKGLDIRLRVPDWIPGLEQALRAQIQKSVKRGSIVLNLRVNQVSEGENVQLDPAAVAGVLTALKTIQNMADDSDVALGATTAADILGQRGVLQNVSQQDDPDAIVKLLTAELGPLLKALVEMRAAEGANLGHVLSDQIDQVEDLIVASEHAVKSRKTELQTAFKDAIGRILEQTDAADEGRLEQELAILAVKTDVTEELDRLKAHVDAARTLLKAKEPIGRKFDFLMQEFNREANTLCSKSQSAALTRVGLDLKACIDQMREQVQNVE